MPKAGVNVLCEVKTYLLAVHNDATLLLQSGTKVAIDEAGKSLII